MATTTQVTPYRSAGQPDDSVGAVGDVCFDTTNRIYWVKQSGNTWVGGGYSNIGPVGPAQLASNGPPASGFGQIGNGCTDQASGNTFLKTSSGWQQLGNILGPAGAIGPQGFTSVQNFASCYGRCAYANSITASSTATVLTEVANTLPIYFAPQNASALTGVSINNNGSGQYTVALYDTTAGATIWSGSSPNGSGTVYNSFTATQYPLTTGHVYQWQVTGSGTANLVVQPFYMLPSGSSTQGAGLVQGFTSPAGTTLSSTVQYLGPGAKVSTSNSSPRNYSPVRAGLLLNAQGLYIPSTQGAASATATFTIYYYVTSSGSGGTLTSFTATNNGVPQNTAFSLSLSSGTLFYIGVTGSGVGQVDAQLQVVV